MTNLNVAMMICNEEYWIYAILRELTQVFPVTVYDTGSKDKTIEIIEKYFPQVKLFKVGRMTPNQLGPLKTEIFAAAGYPVLKVDGDEYYPLKTLQELKNYEIEQGKILGFMHQWTLGVRENGKLYRREGKSADSVFLERTTWRQDYPYECNSLWDDSSKHFYYNGDWNGLHLHHLRRSSLDDVTYGRVEKLNNYPPIDDKGDIDIEELIPPDDVLRSLNPYFK